jgi:hypothetical protein
MAETVEGAGGVGGVDVDGSGVDKSGVDGSIEEPEVEASDAGRSRARLGEVLGGKVLAGGSLTGGELTKASRRLMTPEGCRAYMRRTLSKEFPGIMDGFVEAAKTGSVPHLKLVTELLRPTRQGTSRAKGPAARFFEKLEKEKLERERLKAEKQGIVISDKG